MDFTAEIDRLVAIAALERCAAHHQEVADQKRSEEIAQLAQEMVKDGWFGKPHLRGDQAAIVRFDKLWEWPMGVVGQKYRLSLSQVRRATNLADKLKSEALQHVRFSSDVIGWLKDFLP